MKKMTQNDNYSLAILDETVNQVVENGRSHTGALVVIVVVLVSILISIPTIISRISLPISDQSSVDKFIGYAIIFCLLAMTCAIAIGYRVSAPFRILRSKPFTVLDYLIVLSLIGNFGRTIFIFCHSPTYESWYRFENLDPGRLIISLRSLSSWKVIFSYRFVFSLSE